MGDNVLAELPSSFGLLFRVPIGADKDLRRVAVDLAEYLVRRFGGAFATTTWDVHRGEIPIAEGVSLSNAQQVSDALAAHRGAYHLSATSDLASESLVQISKWDRRSLWVSVNAQWSEVDFEPSRRSDQLAGALLALDERYRLLEPRCGDMWTGSYRLLTNRGDDIDFEPYGWILKLPPRLASATERLASAEYSVAGLSDGATLVWWTGGTPLEFWTGEARQKQRDLLGDLFPARENWAIERMLLSDYRHHVLEADLTLR